LLLTFLQCRNEALALHFGGGANGENLQQGYSFDYSPRTRAAGILSMEFQHF
jgi:hypothetical protein